MTVLLLLVVALLARVLPDPAVEPFWDVEPAARFLGIGRSLAYELIRRGEFPVPVLRFGTRVKIPTRALLEAAGLDGPDAS